MFCDLIAPDLSARLDAYQELPTVRGVRQIVGRAPGEDARTGTNALLENPRFVAGLREVGKRGLTFDLQLIPELMRDTARALEAAPVVRCRNRKNGLKPAVAGHRDAHEQTSGTQWQA